jgi:hypothetical protein
MLPHGILATIVTYLPLTSVGICLTIWRLSRRERDALYQAYYYQHWPLASSLSTPSIMHDLHTSLACSSSSSSSSLGSGGSGVSWLSMVRYRHFVSSHWQQGVPRKVYSVTPPRPTGNYPPPRNHLIKTRDEMHKFNNGPARMNS